MKLDDLGLSPRASNCLKRHGILTVEKLMATPTKKLRAIRGMGAKSLDEIEEKLKTEALPQTTGTEKEGVWIELSMTEEQARIVSIACEFYARIRMGQFNEIIFRCYDVAPLPADHYDRKEEAEQLLLAARKRIYPELHGIGHSYGIGKFKDADLSFDVHQVIRYALGDDRPPFSYYPLPECTKNEWEKEYRISHQERREDNAK